MSKKAGGLFSYQIYLILARFRPHVERPTFRGGLLAGVLILLSNLTLAYSVQEVPDKNTNSSGRPPWVEAKQLIAKQKWNEAAGLLKVLSAQNPRDRAIAYAFTSSLMHLGRRSEAVRLLLQLAEWEKDPAENARLTQKSLILSRIFLSNGSFERYQEGLNALLGKKYRLAQEKFENVLVSESQNCEVLIKLAQCFLLEDEPAAAIQRLTLAKNINPSDSAVSLWLGKAYLALGNAREALREFKYLDPKLRVTEVAALAIAEAQSLGGMPGLALRTLQTDLDENPLHVQALWLSAKIKLQTSKVDLEGLWSARKDLQLALSRVSNYSSEEMLDWEMSSGVHRSAAELKLEFQKLFQQVQSRIDELSHRS